MLPLTKKGHSPKNPCRSFEEANVDDELRGQENQKYKTVEIGDRAQNHFLFGEWPANTKSAAALTRKRRARDREENQSLEWSVWPLPDDDVLGATPALNFFRG
jgi:hypothetical protein